MHALAAATRCPLCRQCHRRLMTPVHRSTVFIVPRVRCSLPTMARASGMSAKWPQPFTWALLNWTCARTQWRLAYHECCPLRRCLQSENVLASRSWLRFETSAGVVHLRPKTDFSHCSGGIAVHGQRQLSHLPAVCEHVRRLVGHCSWIQAVHQELVLLVRPGFDQSQAIEIPSAGLLVARASPPSIVQPLCVQGALHNTAHLRPTEFHVPSQEVIKQLRVWRLQWRQRRMCCHKCIQRRPRLTDTRVCSVVVHYDCSDCDVRRHTALLILHVILLLYLFHNIQLEWHCIA